MILYADNSCVLGVRRTPCLLHGHWIILSDETKKIGVLIWEDKTKTMKEPRKVNT